MNKITVLDSIMGSGKSTYVINMLNDEWVKDLGKSFTNPEHQPKKYLVVTPLLSEVDRYIASCSDLRFRQPTAGCKLNNLLRLISDGENVVTTHYLFKMLTRDIYDALKDKEYTLIVDEALNCVDIYQDLSPNDQKLLFEHSLVCVDQTTNRLKWNEQTHSEYYGRFSNIKQLCETGCLVYMSDKTLFQVFPSEFLRCFSDVIICTYLFRGSPFYAYLKTEGFEISLKTVRQGALEEPSYADDLARLQSLKNQITIYQGQMNGLGKEAPRSHPLSSSWYNRATPDVLKRLKSSAEMFFQRVAKTGSSDNGWTCFKKSRGKLKGKGYTKGFIPCNVVATNKYAHKKSLAYLCNIYVNPILKRYFASRGVEIDEEVYALSSMVQWMWRSSIRNGEPITVFIPSYRMRNLLERWLEGEFLTDHHEDEDKLIIGVTENDEALSCGI